MAWEVEFTDEFEAWWYTLPEDVQDAIDVAVRLLEEKGPHLPFPQSSGISGSRHRHLRELRVQRRGDPYRIFYAFDHRRIAILLTGGMKRGDDRFYDSMVSQADDLYDEHLLELDRERSNGEGL